MGIQVGHSCLHRWVQQAPVPNAQACQPMESASIDGGKIQLRCETGGKGEWRDYQAVSHELSILKRPQAQRFRDYLQNHGHRIPNYAAYVRGGIPIGSGDVESKIKQIGARIKLTGASWKQDNVPQILRLRCADVNHDPCLSISA